MWTRIVKRLSLSLQRVFLVFTLLLVAAFGWGAWSGYRLRAFCAAAAPGIAVAEIPRLAREHRLDFVREIRNTGAAQGEGGSIYARAMGPVLTECAIRHDGRVVLEAKIDYP